MSDDQEERYRAFVDWHTKARKDSFVYRRQFGRILRGRRGPDIRTAILLDWLLHREEIGSYDAEFDGYRWIRTPRDGFGWLDMTRRQVDHGFERMEDLLLIFRQKRIDKRAEGASMGWFSRADWPVVLWEWEWCAEMLGQDPKFPFLDLAAPGKPHTNLPAWLVEQVTNSDVAQDRKEPFFCHRSFRNRDTPTPDSGEPTPDSGEPTPDSGDSLICSDSESDSESSSSSRPDDDDSAAQLIRELQTDFRQPGKAAGIVAAKGVDYVRRGLDWFNREKRGRKDERGKLYGIGYLNQALELGWGQPIEEDIRKDRAAAQKADRDREAHDRRAQAFREQLERRARILEEMEIVWSGMTDEQQAEIDAGITKHIRRPGARHLARLEDLARRRGIAIPSDRPEEG